MGKTAKGTRQPSTRLTCHAPEAQAVSVAGTFNDWDAVATPLARDADGNWSALLDLPPGRHEYKFIVDGAWYCEPGCEGTYHGCPKCVPNAFGTMNRVVDVAKE
jgi:1,4-alpha-glucan branching enzyme